MIEPPPQTFRSLLDFNLLKRKDEVPDYFTLDWILAMHRFTAFTFMVLVVGQSAFADKNRTETSNMIDHVTQKVVGWTVHVDTALIDGEHKELGKRALRLLDDKLFELTLRLPEKRIKQLQTIAIWIDARHELTSMQYHPGQGWLKNNGYDPLMVKGVHIPQAQRFVDHVANHSQPWALLHELAHAYHDQFLGWDHRGVSEAYDDFVSKKKYKSVLHISGRHREHYALTNNKEFFAEMSESFLGTNDFYPFVRGELREELPETHVLMQAIWIDE